MPTELVSSAWIRVERGLKPTMVLLDQGGRSREGDVRLLRPPADLRGLVEHISVQRHPEGACDWRVVPDPSPHIVAAIVIGSDGPHMRPVLVGPRSRMAVIDVSRRGVTIGIRLRPGSIRALVSASAAEFADRAVPLDEAFNGRLLRNLEIAADAPPALLVSELLRMVRRAARGSTPAAIARTLDLMCSVRDIADALATPERTVREQALREIGLPAKRALRIMRLHRALWTARRRDLSWSAIAHLAGYADQAHLTRDCRALLDHSPTQWIARGVAGPFKTVPVEIR